MFESSLKQITHRYDNNNDYDNDNDSGNGNNNDDDNNNDNNNNNNNNNNNSKSTSYSQTSCKPIILVYVYFLSFFSVFVSASLPYNLGSTDNQHHFSDANYKVTLTVKILRYNETDHFTPRSTFSTILFETRET